MLSDDEFNRVKNQVNEIFDLRDKDRKEIEELGMKVLKRDVRIIDLEEQNEVLRRQFEEGQKRIEEMEKPFDYVPKWDGQ